MEELCVIIHTRVALLHHRSCLPKAIAVGLGVQCKGASVSPWSTVSARPVSEAVPSLWCGSYSPMRTGAPEVLTDFHDPKYHWTLKIPTLDLQSSSRNILSSTSSVVRS